MKEVAVCCDDAAAKLPYSHCILLVIAAPERVVDYTKVQMRDWLSPKAWGLTSVAWAAATTSRRNPAVDLLQVN